MVVALQFYSAMGRLLNLEEFSYIHRWHCVMRNPKTHCSCLFGKNLWQNRASIFCWNPSPTHHHEKAQFALCIAWCHLYDLSLKLFQVSSFMLENLATSLTMKHKSEVDVYMRHACKNLRPKDRQIYFVFTDYARITCTYEFFILTTHHPICLETNYWYHILNHTVYHYGTFRRFFYGLPLAFRDQ